MCIRDRPEKKQKVKALMIAGVAASVVSGITEPLEFAFMFVAPQLFVFHAVCLLYTSRCV